MDKKSIERTKALIARDFDLEIDHSVITEEELFHLLANQIAFLIEHKFDILLSLMYRLDIAEHKVNFALSPSASEPPNIGLTKLVMERQLQRIQTKQSFKPPNIPGWEF